MAPEAGEQLRASGGDVAGAQGEDEVARLQALLELREELGAGVDVGDVGVPVGAHRLGERLAADAGNRLFPRGVDAGEEEHVGVVEGADEVFQQVPGAGVAVRWTGW